LEHPPSDVTQAISTAPRIHSYQRSSTFIIFQILDVDTSRNRIDQNSVSPPRKQEFLKEMNAEETDKTGCAMPQQPGAKSGRECFLVDEPSRFLRV